MASTLLACSMIRTLYDRGDDYIDSFWPFVVRVLFRKSTPLGLTDLQNLLTAAYGLEIPEHSLTTILTRAKRRSLIHQQERIYELSPKGREYASTMEDEAAVTRRIDHLLQDAATYLTQMLSTPVTPEAVRDLLEAFVREHIEFFVTFINPTRATPAMGLRPDSLQTQESTLFEYIKEVEHRSPAIFATLRDIVLGSIISAILQGGSVADVTKRFKRTQIYLDTNLLLAISGLHFDQFERPARELVSLMTAAGSFDLRVFDFTVDELVRVLKGYAREQHRYVPHLAVNSIYSSMKNKGWTPTDVLTYVGRVEEEIWKLGVNVTRTGIRLDEFQPTIAKARDCLIQFKPNQQTLEQNHDLAAVEEIEKLRRGPVRLLEHARALFLTADQRLAKYDVLAHGHRDRGTVGEVILDRVLTNMLWLKNPSVIKTLSLDSIIAMHSRDLFIDRSVWTRFVETLGKLKAEGRVVDEDISLLLYDREVENFLRSYGADEAKRVTADVVLAKVAEAKERFQKKTEERIAVERARFDAAMAKAEQDRVDGILDRLTVAKQRIRERASRVSRQIFSAAVLVALAILVVGSLWIVPLVLGQWNLIEPIAWLISLLISLVLVISGYKWDSFGLGERLRSWLFNAIYRVMLRTSEIEHIEAELSKVTSGPTEEV